jgi:hypothetical protein
MTYIAVIAGLLILCGVLLDTFETIILPRSVSRPLRLTRLFTDGLWRVWRFLAVRIKSHAPRESFLSAFGPLVLVLLIAFWAILLLLGFALIQYGLQTPIRGEEGSFAEHLYLSGVTLFTLGYGDMTASSALGRTVAVIEAGVGFGFLAIVISYLPVEYQAFSKRESTILLLDARAGSPPVGCNLLARHSQDMQSLKDLLAEFERWSAQLLESYLSYPILAFYRSQHDKLTWLGTLTAILDACALLKLEFKHRESWHRPLHRQAELTYAMARHMIVDVAYILDAPPVQPEEDRLPPEEFRKLLNRLETWGISLHDNEAAQVGLAKLRREYEPYLCGLAKHLVLSVPPVWREEEELDSWQTSAWDDTAHF